ncbi:MAG: hypothetical protein AAF127_11010 [Pseudomonadota bacterium]
MRPKGTAFWAVFGLVAASLTACKPPPTDAGLDGEVPEAEVVFASEPQPSPETEGAVWVNSAEPQRIIYGVPGGPALMALACEGAGAKAMVRITRMARADEDAGALMALVGNGHFGRIEVDATEVNGRTIWEGAVPVDDRALEPLRGPRALEVTVPGAGTLALNPSPLPMRLLSRCLNS